MPFPIAAVLDDGNRSDESPISQSGNWTTIDELSALRVVSNQIASVASYGGSYRGRWVDMEVYATIATLSGSHLLTTRYQDAGGASPIRDSRRRGYQLDALSTTYALTRMDDGASGAALIAATSWPGGNIASGDAVGLRSAGSLHEIWLKRAAGSWTLVATATDATYVNPSAVALQFQSTTARVDDVGGGDITYGWMRIVGPMPLGATAAPRYTVPTGRRLVIRHIHAQNRGASSRNLTVSIGTDAASVRLFDGYPLAAGAQLDEGRKHVLAAGEKIEAYASAADDVVLTITGELIAT